MVFSSLNGKVDVFWRMWEKYSSLFNALLHPVLPTTEDCVVSLMSFKIFFLGCDIFTSIVCVTESKHVHVYT